MIGPKRKKDNFIASDPDFDFDTTHLTHEDIIEKIINKLKIF